MLVLANLKLFFFKTSKITCIPICLFMHVFVLCIYIGSLSSFILCSCKPKAFPGVLLFLSLLLFGYMSSISFHYSVLRVMFNNILIAWMHTSIHTLPNITSLLNASSFYHSCPTLSPQVCCRCRCSFFCYLN